MYGVWLIWCSVACSSHMSTIKSTGMFSYLHVRVRYAYPFVSLDNYYWLLRDLLLVMISKCIHVDISRSTSADYQQTSLTTNASHMLSGELQLFLFNVVPKRLIGIM